MEYRTSVSVHLDKEEHVKDIAFMTTLAGYIHWQMTGEKVLGVGDASGMFPIDMNTKDYDEEMIQKFDKLIEGEHYPWKVKDILPKVLVAGDAARYPDRRRSKDFLTLQVIWKQEFRSARRKEMQEQVW